MSSTAGELKAALRRQLRTESKAHSAAQRATSSEQIRRRLREQEVWRRSRCVLFYVPMADEPDIAPLIADALAAGKIVTLPRYFAAQNHYEAREIQTAECDLKRGQFGVPEPSEDCPILDLNRLDFVLVPGLGFALNGVRLGRGKGYYDRLLAQVPGLKCGVAFDWQVIAAVPAEPHDVRLNCILTPTRWHEV